MARHAHFFFYSSSHPLHLKKEGEKRYFNWLKEAGINSEILFCYCTTSPPTSCLWGWVNRGEIAELPLQLLYAAAATKALSRRRYLSNCRRHITGFLAAQPAATTAALCIISSVPNRGGWGGGVAGSHPPTGERQDFEAPPRVVNSSGVSGSSGTFFLKTGKINK